MTHFFEKRDRWGNGMALWVLVAMAFAAPLAYWSLKQVDLDNNIETWLPEDDPHRQLLTWYLEQFSREDRILVSWEGSTLHDPRISRFAERLEGVEDAQGIRRDGVKQIHSVLTPIDMIKRMVKYGVEPDEAIRRLRGTLIGTGPAKVCLTEVGRFRRKSTLYRLTQEAKHELGIELEILDPITEWIPPEDYFKDQPLVTDDATKTSEQVELPAIAQHDFQIRWKGMNPNSETAQQVTQFVLSLRGEATREEPDGVRLVESCVFTPGAPVGVSVALSEAGIEDVSATLAAIQQTATDVGIPLESLHLGGRPVAGSALNRAVSSAAWNSKAPAYLFHKRSVVLLSAIVGTAVAFLLLRSVLLTGMILISTYYAVFVTASLVPVTGGSMNMVLIVMPTLLMVITLSAGIHLANYWKHSAQKDRTMAVVSASRMAKLPCVMASLTTAIGLLSLLTSPLAPVRDFGMYSAVGCVISLIMVLYVLPAFLQVWPPSVPESTESERSGWRSMGLGIAKARTPLIASAIVLCAAASFGLKWFRTETKAIRYFPEHSQIVQDYHFLEENLANIVPVEMLVCFDPAEQQRLNFLERMEIVRDIQEQIREHREISGALSLADFVKKSEPVSENASRVQKLLAVRKANEVEKRIKEGAESGAASFLAVADEDAEFIFDGRNFRVSKGDEVWRITAQVAIMSDYDYGNLANDAQRGEFDEIAKAKLKYHPGTKHVVTGIVPVFLRTQQAVLESLILSFGLAFGVIAIMMMAILKDPFAGLLAMFPNLVPVGVVFGLLSWFGVAVDVGTMITASVALGIAVDGTLHQVTWFRNGIAKGLSRTEAVAESLSHCGPALWQTTLVIGLGMVMLYPAELLLVSRFGWLMAAIIGSAFVANAILLSALLAGPLGGILQRVQAAAAELEREQSARAPVAAPHMVTHASSGISKKQQG